MYVRGLQLVLLVAKFFEMTTPRRRLRLGYAQICVLVVWCYIRRSARIAWRAIKTCVSYYRNRVKYYRLSRRDADNHVLAVNRPTFYPAFRECEHFDSFALSRLHLQQKSHWSKWEISIDNLDKSINELQRHLNPRTRQIYRRVFVFQAISDSIVCNVLSTLTVETTMPEIKACFITEAANNIVHAEMHGIVSQLLLCKEEWQLLEISHELMTSPKLAWVSKWSEPGTPFIVRCMLALIMKCLWYSCDAILIDSWRKNKIMLELVKLKDYIMIDVELHREIYAWLLLEYFKFETRADLKAVFLEMAQEAYEAELTFIEYVVGRSEENGIAEALVNQLQVAYEIMLQSLKLPPANFAHHHHIKA